MVSFPVFLLTVGSGRASMTCGAVGEPTRGLLLTTHLSEGGGCTFLYSYELWEHVESRRQLKL